MAQQITVVTLHKDFKKHYKKRISPSANLVKQFAKRYQQFLSDPNEPLLKDHALTGSMQGKRSFSITGDYRVVYRQISETEVEFLDVGTHTQVYR